MITIRCDLYNTLFVVCYTWFQPLLVPCFSLQRWMNTAGKCRSVMFMDVLNMVDHTFPLRLHYIWISIRRGSCSPVEVVNNSWPPQLQVLTVPLLCSSIQSFPYTCFRTETHCVKKENVIINNSQPKQNYLYQDTYFYQYAKCQRNGLFLVDTTPPAPT